MARLASQTEFDNAEWLIEQAEHSLPNLLSFDEGQPPNKVVIMDVHLDQIELMVREYWGFY